MTLKYAKVGKRHYFHNSVLRLVERYEGVSEDPQEIIRIYR